MRPKYSAGGLSEKFPDSSVARMNDDIGVIALTRRTHEMRVLAVLRAFGVSSRARLAEATRLFRTTLSEIVTELIARGAVVVADTDAVIAGALGSLIAASHESPLLAGYDGGRPGASSSSWSSGVTTSSTG